MNELQNSVKISDDGNSLKITFVTYDAEFLGAKTSVKSNAGDGNDVICGFANDDLWQITGVFTGTYNRSKKELAFTFGKLK